MRSSEGEEGTRNSGCGRFLHDLPQQFHNLLKELFPTLSLSEVRNYISSSLCLCLVFVLQVLLLPSFHFWNSVLFFRFWVKKWKYLKISFVGFKKQLILIILYGKKAIIKKLFSIAKDFFLLCYSCLLSMVVEMMCCWWFQGIIIILSLSFLSYSIIYYLCLCLGFWCHFVICHYFTQFVKVYWTTIYLHFISLISSYTLFGLRREFVRREGNEFVRIRK